MKNRDIPAVAEMSFSEKLQLVEDLWDDIAQHPDELSLTNEQKAELDRRWEEYQRNPNEGSSWADVKKRILGQA